MQKTRQLTPKQKRFADLYIQLGNATEAAKQAGYSFSTAKSIGAENLTKPDIKKYIEERLKQLDDEAIADQEEILREITAIMRNKNQKASARLKAAELLMKRYNMFAPEDQEIEDTTIKVQFVSSKDEIDGYSTD